ncbi:zinc ribbon domain-containing protein [Herbaspirillum sp. HC18]|nr:zinc ribbon domain-containing protein [Herbaspirillum sp. HC18]
MFCAKCGAQIGQGATYCTSCGARGTPSEQPQVVSGLDSSAVPNGVKGWSWGAFLLNWIWAIGNRTWWGLLALIPYVGFIIAVWLGIKGREMAWKNGKWDNLDHFNRVQRRWSQWGVVLVVGVCGIGILAAIAIPAYQDYVQRAKASTSSSAAESSSTLNEGSSTRRTTAPSKSSSEWEKSLPSIASEINKGMPMNVDRDTVLQTTSAGPGNRFKYHYVLVNIEATDLSSESIAAFSQVVTNRVCTNNDLKVFLENGTTVTFSYQNNAGVLLTNIDVTPANCKPTQQTGNAT